MGKYRDTWSDKKISIPMKVGISFVNGILDAAELIKDKTGFDVMEYAGKQKEKDDMLREEKPVKWTIKHMGIGTLKGLFGGLQ